MKKFLAMLLCVALVAALGISAFAEVSGDARVVVKPAEPAKRPTLTVSTVAAGYEKASAAKNANPTRTIAIWAKSEMADVTNLNANVKKALKSSAAQLAQAQNALKDAKGDLALAQSTLKAAQAGVLAAIKNQLEVVKTDFYTLANLKLANAYEDATVTLINDYNTALGAAVFGMEEALAEVAAQIATEYAAEGWTVSYDWPNFAG